MTNLLRTICTKLYHNRSGFVDCISKIFWCVFFGSQCRHRHAREVYLRLKDNPVRHFYLINLMIFKLYCICYFVFICSVQSTAVLIYMCQFTAAFISANQEAAARTSCAVTLYGTKEPHLACQAGRRHDSPAGRWPGFR